MSDSKPMVDEITAKDSLLGQIKRTKGVIGAPRDAYWVDADNCPVQDKKAPNSQTI